jgi:hypothetical protein
VTSHCDGDRTNKIFNAQPNQRDLHDLIIFRKKKMPYVNEVLGGLSRITFQMGVSTLPHQKMVRSIELPGTRVAPVVRKELTLLSSR